MYVCSCYKVTERQITRAMNKGARTLPELQQTLKVGTNCGSCLEHAEFVMQQHREQWSDLDYNLATQVA